MLIFFVPGGNMNGLDLGEAAAPVQISEWVKGNPLNFDRGRGSNVFVLDF